MKVADSKTKKNLSECPEVERFKPHSLGVWYSVCLFVPSQWIIDLSDIAASRHCQSSRCLIVIVE